jgi:hypothetical protein
MEEKQLVGKRVSINNKEWKIADKTFRYGREWQYTLSHEDVGGTYKTIRINEDALLNIIESGSKVIDEKYESNIK